MTIPVFYRPEMVAESGAYSPSAAKPRLVVEDWLAHFGEQIEVVSFAPATANTIALAHDRQHVDDVLALRRDNGFGNRRPDVAASLPYTVGSIVAAAKYVATAGVFPPEIGYPDKRCPVVAVSPTSGFHHARYSAGGGFCTFNGLVIAAQALLTRGLASRVSIIDFDFHYGNGTDDIIERLYPGSVAMNRGCFELCEYEMPDFLSAEPGHRYLGWVKEEPAQEAWPPIVHYSAGAHTKAECRSPEDVMRHIGRSGGHCDVFLYQAGADQHIDDPLGGWYTTEEMQQRDRQVLRFCANYGFRLVWVLAGGYARDKEGSIAPVIELHRQTMQECVAAYIR